MPVGAAAFAEAPALVRRGLPHPEEGPARRTGLGAGVGDEGGFAPNLKTNEDAAASHRRRPCEAAGYKPGDGHHDRHGRRFHRVLQRREPASTMLPAKAARRLTSAEMVDYCGSAWSTSTPSSPSRTAWPRRTGTAGSMLTEAHRRPRSSWWATTCSSPTPSAWRRASSWACANAILIKVNQIGTLTETLDAIEMAKQAGYTCRHLPPLRRDRGHHHRRPGRGPERRPDQDRRSLPYRPRGQVQPAAAHRGGARHPRPSTPARTLSTTSSVNQGLAESGYRRTG